MRLCVAVCRRYLDMEPNRTSLFVPPAPPNGVTSPDAPVPAHRLSSLGPAPTGVGACLPVGPSARTIWRNTPRLLTVEGNSTFYALPSSAAGARWRDETPEHFRFCFKFPSDLTHR